MSSKDISLALVEHLDMLKKNNTDYLLICLEPGKNTDRADVWYELRDKESPANLIEATLSLFTNLYSKDDLIEILMGYCDVLENGDVGENVEEQPAKPKKKRKSNPNE